MFSLILYGVLAVGALAAIHGFDVSRQNIGRDAQRKLDDPIIAEARKGRDDAIAANASLQASLVTLRGERELCTAQVAEMEAQDARRRAFLAKRKPADDTKSAQLAMEKFDLITALGRPDQGGTCEQQMGRWKSLLDAAAPQRVRDYPPTGAAPPSDAVTIRETRPPAVNPLRVTK